MHSRLRGNTIVGVSGVMPAETRVHGARSNASGWTRRHAARRGAIGGDRTLDIIFIEALRVETVIGVYDWERRIRQPVVIDLEMGADVARAAANDDVADTLDYKAVSKRVQQFVGESSFLLVETLTERIAALVLDEFPVPWVRIRLNKVGALRGAAGVGIVVERGRKPAESSA